ncbi:hypothetical protein [Pseudomonas typographi]|uniref:hypothetical protein n=1 Tax=Pseudomonas typographi TaxID=2715964 RepID=UPI00168577DF|nr:hypothetical protein [Pseudomonas typographi]MBD1586924.1 hypothetical protein [Pseudomonas typographi]
MTRVFDAKLLAACSEAALAQAPACHCLARDLSGWSSWPVAYREEHFVDVGTLARFAPEDATIEEYYPNGTSYWAPEAPIAPHYYPYNQCGVWACVACARLYLRHNDDGAYHADRRIRRVSPGLVVDAPHATDGREPPPEQPDTPVDSGCERII